MKSPAKTLSDRYELWDILPKGMVIAELGTFIGDYAEKILEIAKPKELYIVDIFAKTPGTQWDVTVPDMSVYYDILTGKYCDNPNIHVIKSTTEAFLKTEGKLDCVYIDADHTYPAVYSDLILSYNKVKSGGFICGHDYDKVRKALKKFLDITGEELLYLTNEKERSFVIQT